MTGEARIWVHPGNFPGCLAARFDSVHGPRPTRYER